MSHVVLIGFMGSGKTAVGRRLARRLGYDFIDTDHLIEQRIGMPISEFFSRHGEAEFRRIEHEMVESLAPVRPSVIATGGGTFIQLNNRDALRRLGPVVCLVTSLETALERVGRNDSRPLASGKDAVTRLGKLLEERLPHYRTADVMVETDGLSVEQAVARVATALAPRLRDHGIHQIAAHAPSPPEQRKAHGPGADVAGRSSACAGETVHVNLGARSYQCLVQRGCLATGAARIAALDPSQIFVVTNPTVRALYGDVVEVALAEATPAGRVHVVEVPDGERYKTMTTVETIYDRVLEAGVDRKAVMVALGGGVIGDMTGFAAATILRGIRFAMIPTTLLAHVDSSVGGKTGIDRPHGKNLVGAFHQPSLVLIDPQTLATLPQREYLAGLGEVVKYGVILDRTLFETLEAEAAAVLAREPSVMTPIIARCVRLKADVVEKDEFETTGLRRILNFGHTVAHAIEQVTGYDRYLHGEAVSIGMVVAARLSAQRGLCPPALPHRLEKLLERLGIDHRVPAGLDRDALCKAIALDKKAERSRVAYVICEDLGHCRAETLDVADIAAAMASE